MLKFFPTSTEFEKKLYSQDSCDRVDLPVYLILSSYLWSDDRQIVNVGLEFTNDVRFQFGTLGLQSL